MLKWRYSSGDLAVKGELCTETQTIGRPIKRRRQSLAQSGLVKRCKTLEETTSHQQNQIEALLKDKERSLGLLEDVMSEFHRLDKQIIISQEELDREKQTSDLLRKELKHWRAEWISLYTCKHSLKNDFLDPTMQMISGSLLTLVENGEPIPVLCNQDKCTKRRRSQDETFQNIENESRLESQLSWAGNSQCTGPFSRNAQSDNVKPTSHGNLETVVTEVKTTESDVSSKENPETASPTKSSCFKHIFRRITENKMKRRRHCSGL